MSSRTNVAIALIGTARTGKSTKALEFAALYKRKHPERKVIFVTLQPPEIQRWQGKNHLGFQADHVIHQSQLEDILKQRSKNRQREYLFDPLLMLGPSLIVLDDCKFYTTNEGKEMSRLLIRRGHYNADVLMIYHSFLDVHPKIFGHVNEFWLMRINEGPETCLKRARSGIFTTSHIETANKLKVGQIIKVVQTEHAIQ